MKKSANASRDDRLRENLKQLGLHKILQIYEEYTRQTRYRVIPGVW